MSSPKLFYSLNILRVFFSLFSSFSITNPLTSISIIIYIRGTPFYAGYNPVIL